MKTSAQLGYEQGPSLGLEQGPWTLELLSYLRTEKKIIQL